MHFIEKEDYSTPEARAARYPWGTPPPKIDESLVKETVEADVAIIGGGISGAGRYLLDNVHRILREMGAWAYSDDVIITLARHRNDAGLLGAAALAEYYIEQ